MKLYESFQLKKTSGEVLDFEKLSSNDLKQLHWHEERFDSEIASLFEVTESKVKTKRRKLGITRREMIIEDLLKNNNEEYFEINQKAMKRIINKENINMLSKAMTNFVFRSGPVEDMHANKQLSQDDMKSLNKSIVNRFGYFFNLLIDGRGVELDFLIRSNALFTTEWDTAEADDDNFNLAKQQLLELK